MRCVTILIRKALETRRIDDDDVDEYDDDSSTTTTTINTTTTTTTTTTKTEKEERCSGLRVSISMCGHTECVTLRARQCTRGCRL